MAGSFAVIETLIGGTRLVFSLPTYAALGVIGFLTIASLRRPKPAPNQICLLTSAAFFGYILVRAWFSPVDYLARPDIYSVLGCLLVYLFIACIFTDARRRIWFLFFLLTIAIVHVCVGALQFRDGNNFMLIPFLQRFDYGRRASGLYVNPNHLAGFLEVVGIFGLSIAWWGRWPVWVKLVVLYATGVCYLGVLLTASRGGYVSCAASFVVFLALSLLTLRRTGKQFFMRIGGVVLVGAILVLIAGSFYSDKMLFLNDRTRTTAEETNDVRIDLWKAAVQQFRLEPIVGTGSGTYLFYGRQFRSAGTASDPVEVHNDYLHLLAEYGIVGGIGFLIFFSAHLLNGWKNFQRLGPKRVAVSPRLSSNALALQIGALSAGAAYVVHSALDFNLHIPANALLLAFVFGLIANPGITRGAEPPPPSIPNLWWRVLLVLIGSATVVQSARLLPGEYFAEKSRTSLRDQERATPVYYALRGLATEQKNPNLFYNLGSGLAAEANATEELQKRFSLLQAALLAFQSAHDVAPQDRDYLIALGAVYDALERFPEAEWMYDEAIRLDPKFVPTREAYQQHLEKWRHAGGPKQPQDADPNPK